MLSSTVVAPAYIPTNSVGGFPFLHILFSIYCSQTFFSPFFCHPKAYGVPGPGIRAELQLQPLLHLGPHWILNLLCRAEGSNLRPVALETLLIPLPHSENACLQTFFFFFFLVLYLWHMKGVKPEPQLLAYATGTATQDPRHICDLPHWDLQPIEQGQGLNLHPHGSSWVLNPLSHSGNSLFVF